MKNIFYAKKGKRILARLIDMAIVILLSIIIYFSMVLPLTLDKNTINKNGEEITQLYKESGLFLVDEDGSFNAKCGFSDIKTLSQLENIDITYKGYVYKEVSLTKSLYEYYTIKYNSYGNQYNLTTLAYKSEILKINNSISNILDYDYEENKLTLIDNNNEATTVSYFLEIYQSACKNLISNSKINALTIENQQIVLNSVYYLIPIILLISFIFDFLIPFFSSKNQSIGKKIFNLGLVTTEGYKYKKLNLFFRYLSYAIIELILGILSFGATLLISYTMMLFCKKRRSIHDFIAGSVVIDEQTSIYFSNKAEEDYYNQRKLGKING